MIQLSIPMVPPSVNHYVKHTRQGRHYVSKEAGVFKQLVYLAARECGRFFASGTYKVTVGIFLGKGQKGDIDNFAKVVLDSLTEAGVIHSDAAVMELWMRKHRDVVNPRTEILVTECQ